MTGFNKDEKGQWIAKDPAAVLDYSMDWSTWLEADETISQSTWSVPTGITSPDETNTTTIATVWLAGGVVGREYTITNLIVTTSGRQDERSFRVRIQNR